MSKKDVIRWVIDWMLTNEQAITEDLALRCERAARAEWGGRSQEYIPKTVQADRTAVKHAAYADLLQTCQPVDAVSRRHGLSRRSLYRLVKTGPPE